MGWSVLGAGAPPSYEGDIPHLVGYRLFKALKKNDAGRRPTPGTVLQTSYPCSWVLCGAVASGGPALLNHSW